MLIAMQVSSDMWSSTGSVDQSASA
ncbi:hypothetical protein HaLaN_29042, partial [Haematococcus lacustris]